MVHQKYIRNKTQVGFLLLKLKEFILQLNIFTLLYFFYKKKLTMVSLFENMRSPVSFRQIWSPNHAQVILSVLVLNGWLY